MLPLRSAAVEPGEGKKSDIIVQNDFGFSGVRRLAGRK
jgi:hypothetical protein